MKDERIQTTVNRFAAGGFLILQFLLSISLFYRTLILKQHPREWWDIAAIWFIGAAFVSMAYANKGVFDHEFKRIWLNIVIVSPITVLALLFIMDEMHSIVEVGVFLINFLLGMGLVIAVTYLLNRRWKRKEGIEDEE